MAEQLLPSDCAHGEEGGLSAGTPELTLMPIPGPLHHLANTCSVRAAEEQGPRSPGQGPCAVLAWNRAARPGTRGRLHWIPQDQAGTGRKEAVGCGAQLCLSPDLGNVTSRMSVSWNWKLHAACRDSWVCMSPGKRMPLKTSTVSMLATDWEGGLCHLTSWPRSQEIVSLKLTWGILGAADLCPGSQGAHLRELGQPPCG